MCSGIPVQAQNIVTIERTRTVETQTISGQTIRKFYDAKLSIGNVSLVCDSAWQFINIDEIRAYGNIQIDTPTEHIWTDTLYYYNNRDLSRLRGRVIIKQDSTLLFGNKVDYNFLTKEAFFRDNIRLEDADGTLTALSGNYYQNRDSAEFRGRVQLADSAQYAEGDSLFINRKSKRLKLYGDLFVADSTNNTILKGEFLEADSTGYRYLKEKAFLRRVSSDTTDTTYIHSHELILNEKDSTTYIDSYQNVRVWSPRFSSLSDTLLYNSATDRFRLLGSPKAWHKQIQLTAPFIAVQLDSNEVKKLTAYEGAFAVQEDTITGRLHQLKGDSLFADFEDGEIVQISIYPESEILYHTRNNEGEPDGAMENASPKTILYFSDGELIRAWMGKSQGLFLPEYTDLADRRLVGFSWDPSLRPVKPVSEPEPKWNNIPPERPFELPYRFLEFLDQQ